MNVRKSIAGLLVCGLAVWTAAQEPQPERGQPQQKISAADRQFVQRAAQSNLREVRLGNVAMEKAPTEQVKRLAQTMAADHTKANEQLQRIAADLNIEFPRELDRQHQQTIERMQKLGGSEFEQEYLELMHRDHQDDVRAFQRYTKEGQVSTLKTFAQQQLPVLQHHLSSVQEVRQQRAGGDRPRPGERPQQRPDQER
ncbi:MAG: DUF4142 domain-containing protein [Planctomycetota bacterium]